MSKNLNSNERSSRLFNIIPEKIDNNKKQIVKGKCSTCIKNYTNNIFYVNKNDKQCLNCVKFDQNIIDNINTLILSESDIFEILEEKKKNFFPKILNVNSPVSKKSGMCVVC